MESLRSKKGFLCDMDGVIYKGNNLLPGVKEFVDWLYREKKEFLFLTNSSSKTPRELQQKLARMGLDVDETHFYTSALATAKFLSPCCTGGKGNRLAGPDPIRGCSLRRKYTAKQAVRGKSYGKKSEYRPHQ